MFSDKMLENVQRSVQEERKTCHKFPKKYVHSKNVKTLRDSIDVAR
jgi:hypothetical protein